MIDPSKLKIALLMNAFACPGAGHIAMGRKKKGYLMILFCVSFALAPAFRFGISLAKAMAALPVTTRVWEKLAISLPAAWQAERQFIFICLAGIIILWVYSLFDAYMMARNAKADQVN